MPGNILRTRCIVPFASLSSSSFLAFIFCVFVLIYFFSNIDKSDGERLIELAAFIRSSGE
jgi:hypothetical protein